MWVLSVTAPASSCVLADHSWSGLSGPDTDADATHSQGPPGQDLCNALGERLQVAKLIHKHSYWQNRMQDMTLLFHCVGWEGVGGVLFCLGQIYPFYCVFFFGNGMTVTGSVF